MNANWQTGRLGELYKIERGGSPRPIKSFLTNDEDGINWIKIGDTELGSKYINSTEEKIKPSGIKKSRLVHKGDFLISNSMSFGRPYILNIEGCIHDGWVVLHDISESIDKDYLFYLLSSNYVYNQFDRLASGSTVRNLNTALVRRVEISYPESIQEQKRIVKKLDAIFENIEKVKKNTEKNLKNSKDLFETAFNQIFTNSIRNWDEDMLINLTTKIGSGATPRGGKNSYKDVGTSLIRSLNVYDRGFNNKNLAHIDDIQARQLSNVVIEKGDVLLNITGASIARCCVVPDNILPARVNQHVSIIRPINNKLIPEFLHHCLISKENKDRLLRTGEKGGATRQALTKNQIQNFLIKYPKDMKKQREIVGKIESISKQYQKLEENYKNKLVLLDELKKAVLDKAFRGEL